MSLIYIFSGTSEGRKLVEELAKKEITCHVFVATEYGQAVMEKDRFCNVHVGRMDVEDMVEAIRADNPQIIVDATHPHAVEVTENIKKACDIVGMNDRYVRVSRSIGNIDMDSFSDVTVVESCDMAKDIIAKLEGNILLTTGVKELPCFVGDVGEENTLQENIKDRLVVRILPGHESIAMVEKFGIPSKHIIAMEGPFSQEMNEAIIKQYKIKYLITKNSGSRGGFIEKLEAARACGIKTIVVDSEVCDEGISVEDAIKKICSHVGGSIKKGTCFGVSVGPGDPDLITMAAMKVIKAADYIFLPNAPKEKCRVYQIIKAAAPWIDDKKIVCDEGSAMTNPMFAGKRYDRLADKVGEILDQGYDVAFPALGSALLFSTYFYVHDRLVQRGYACKLVSGITSIQEAARVHGLSLAQGEEEVHIFPNGEDLEDKLAQKGTKVFMKPKGELKEFTDRIAAYCEKHPELKAYGVSNLGGENEIVAVGHKELDRLEGYMSLIIVK